MKGLDTNVLIRYLVKDDKKQAERASTCIRKATANGESCFINHIVLCELVWVLESAYGYTKEEIAEVLEKMLITKQFEIELKDIVRQTIYDYMQGSGDIADYLIGRINHIKGCDVTATFDHALKNNPSFIVLD
ncbi:MAG: type II toxin-antitoxin system VapC family toxin [Nitrospirae bacterium]|nr:type II toxin-antitoxin system VapC family toxin [Nitrospirota bacterium]